jgi:hypothetical protein
LSPKLAENTQYKFHQTGERLDKQFQQSQIAGAALRGPETRHSCWEKDNLRTPFSLEWRGIQPENLRDSQHSLRRLVLASSFLAARAACDELFPPVKSPIQKLHTRRHDQQS